MLILRSLLLLTGIVLLGGCGKEPPPRSVISFLENPILLEAAMVRCAQDRDATRYDAECVNARQAVAQIEAREERTRREAFELQSERKREALIRTQKAAAEARRRAAEAEKLREESEYLAQFGEVPPEPAAAGGTEASNAPGALISKPMDAEPDGTVIYDDPRAAGSNAPASAAGANAPGAVIPKPMNAEPDQTVIYDDPRPASADGTTPASAVGANAPAAEVEADGGLDAVRDELRRRAEESNN